MVSTPTTTSRSSSRYNRRTPELAVYECRSFHHSHYEDFSADRERHTNGIESLGICYHHPICVCDQCISCTNNGRQIYVELTMHTAVHTAVNASGCGG